MRAGNGKMGIEQRRVEEFVDTRLRLIGEGRMGWRPSMEARHSALASKDICQVWWRGCFGVLKRHIGQTKAFEIQYDFSRQTLSKPL